MGIIKTCLALVIWFVPLTMFTTWGVAGGADPAVPDYVGAEYERVGPTITLEWDAVDTADRYELLPIWVDPKPTAVEYPIVTTTELSVTLEKPRSSGHFVFKVRACNDSGCSEWASSLDETHSVITDPETGETVPGKWRVYFKVAPILGPPTIEDMPLDGP